MIKIRYIIFNNKLTSKNQYFSDNVTKCDKIFGNLSKLTWEICHVSLDKFRKTPESVKNDWWKICHVSFDRYVNADMKSHLTWSPDQLDYPFLGWLPIWVNSHIQLIQQGWTIGEKKTILPSPPFLTVVSGVSDQKSPIPLYSQETRIPGLRECVGAIIPSPGTLNRTFLRDLNTLAVLAVV